MQLELQIADIVDKYKNKANENKLKTGRIKKTSHREINLPLICIWYNFDLTRNSDRNLESCCFLQLEVSIANSQ
jgi:hypothetical protein